jgi:arylformamidase
MKGPAVWLDMDQAELDAAYNQAVYAPNVAEVLQRYADRSEAARAAVGEPLRFAYGDSAIEGLDVYPTGKPDAPIAIFIHGGAWRSGRARDYGFPAELFVRAGAHLVVPDFAAVQDVDGNLMAMADQVRRAVAWVYAQCAAVRRQSAAHPCAGAFVGRAPGGCGADHRLGGHASACRPIFVKGGLCCSGIFDLKPPRLSARSSYVRFTDEIEEALSPQRHLGQTQGTAHRGLRHAGDARVPAPVARLCRRGGRRWQAGAAAGG